MAAPSVPKPFWSKASRSPTFSNPIVPDYSTGEASRGDQRLVAGNNAALVGPASDLEPRKTAFHRGAIESNGARLAISPSAKVPQNDPASGMNLANTKIVRSRVAGRSVSTFMEGMVG